MSSFDRPSDPSAAQMGHPQAPNPMGQPVVETVETAADGTTIKTSEYVRPDGGRSVVVERTDPAGVSTVETVDYPPPRPTGQLNVPDMVGKDVETDNRPDGSTLVTTVLRYSDGSRDVIEEETRVDGTKMVTETRVPPPGANGGGAAMGPGQGPGPQGGANYPHNGNGVPPLCGAAPYTNAYGGQSTIPPPPPSQGIEYLQGFQQPPTPQQHMSGPPLPEPMSTPTPPPLYSEHEPPPVISLDLPGSGLPPPPPQSHPGHDLNQHPLRPPPPPQSNSSGAHNGGAGGGAVAGGAGNAMGSSGPDSSKPPKNSVSHPESCWSRRRNRILVCFVALLAVVGVVIGALFGTGTIGGGSSPASSQGDGDVEASTTTPPPPTSSPAPTSIAPPTRPGIDGSGNLAALYSVVWTGAIPEEGACDLPTPGIDVTCGSGGKAELLEEFEEGQCQMDNSRGAITCRYHNNTEIGNVMRYRCVGSNFEALATHVEIVGDESVHCSVGNNAGYSMFLARDCPRALTLDWNSIQCDPPDAVLTDDEGDQFCVVQNRCPLGESCILDIPPLGASIPRSAVTANCVIDVVEPGPTPAPTHAPTPAPNPASSDAILFTLYQVQWIGVKDGNCTTPHSSVIVTCGDGGQAIALDDTGTGTCTDLFGVVRCSLRPNETSMILLYACAGDGTQESFTTRVEVETDGTVSCSSSGFAGDAVFLSRDCPEVEERDFRSMLCDPEEATLTDSTGDPYCFASDDCLVSSGCASLSVPSIASYVPEEAIEVTCIHKLASNDTAPPPRRVVAGDDGNCL